MGKNWLLVDKVALAALVAVWAIAAYGALTLPSSIAIGFRSSGAPLAFGSRLTLFYVPLIALVVSVGIALAMRFVRRRRFPFVVSEGRWDDVIRCDIEMQRVLRAVFVGDCAFIEWFRVASARDNWLSPGMVPSLLLLFAAKIVGLIVHGVRLRRVARG